MLLHTQEVRGSSPCAPTTPLIDFKRVVQASSHHFRLSFTQIVSEFEPPPFAWRFSLANASRFI